MIRIGIGAALWISGIIILGFLADKTQFEMILSGYSIAFAGYMILSKDFNQRSILIPLVIIALLGRIVLAFSFPQLSDDIYRFIWDAHLQADGISLLEGTPRQMLSGGVVDTKVYQELFPYLNSKDYFTVYPTFIQWMNRTALLIGGGNTTGFLLTLRTFHLIADIISFLVIYKLNEISGMRKGIAWWYVLNPLLIVECTGNLHYEGIAISLLLISIVFTGKKLLASSVSLSSSILVKLNPALLLPILFRTWDLRRGLGFFFINLVISMSVLFIGFGEDAMNLKNSISLYFQSFEFNAGPYYLVRQLGQWIVGYNAIAVVGPILSLVALIIILLIAYRSDSKSHKAIINSAFLSYLTYILLSTTIHPWYILYLLALGILTRWRAVAIIWSFTVVFSYSHYWGADLGPKWGWVISEYMILLLSFYILYRKQKIH